MLWTERLGLSMDEGVGFIAEKGQGQFKTAVALTSGDSVVISALTTEESREQVTITNVGTTATRHKLIGAYQGIGGTGAVNTTSGSPGGRNALAGDLVWVTMHGIATTLVEGTTDVAADDPLMMMNSATGTLIIAVASASNVAGSHYGVFSLAAQTSATPTFTKVYFRCV